MSRGAGKIFCPGRCPDKLEPIVRDRAHLSQRAIGRTLVPLVQRNLMAVGVRSGADGSVTSRCNKVGVIVVAVCEVRSLFEKQVPAVLRIELGAIPIEVVPTELIEHKNNDQLRPAVVRVARCSVAVPGFRAGSGGVHLLRLGPAPTSIEEARPFLRRSLLAISRTIPP